MPGFIGKRLCRELVFVKPNKQKYEKECDKIRSMLREFDPYLETPSPDEFLLDVTNYIKSNNMDSDIGRIFIGDRIRKLIFEGT